MFSYLDAIAAACAVNEKFIVNIDGDVVDLQPAFATPCAAAPDIRAITLAAACILTGEKDKVACLKLACVGKQYAHIAALLRHARGGQAVYGG